MFKKTEIEADAEGIKKGKFLSVHVSNLLRLGVSEKSNNG